MNNNVPSNIDLSKLVLSGNQIQGNTITQAANPQHHVPVRRSVVNEKRHTDRQDISGRRSSAGLGMPHAGIHDFYVKLEDVIDSCLLYMPHLYADQKSVLECVHWYCKCDVDSAIPISYSYCPKCFLFPDSETSVVILHNSINEKN